MRKSSKSKGRLFTYKKYLIATKPNFVAGRRSKAFLLLEVLIAFAVVMVVVLGAIRTQKESWQMTEKTTKRMASLASVTMAEERPVGVRGEGCAVREIIVQGDHAIKARLELLVVGDEQRATVPDCVVQVWSAGAAAPGITMYRMRS